MEKPKNRILPIILIILGVVVIGLVIFLVVTKLNNKQEMENVDPSIEEKTCEMKVDFEEDGYTINMITYLKVKDGRVISVQSIDEYKFQNIDSYNLIKGTVDAEILEDNENELFLRYKMSDAVDATKNDAGEAQELMYADYKSERESIGATCN